MEKHVARVNFSGQQSSCMVATSWTPNFTTIGPNKIQILKLEQIQDGKHQSHYVSANFSGINTNDLKFIQINGNFARSLNLNNGEEIGVSEISQVPPTVKNAFVSCVCLDDWEILDSNSEIVTNSLLNQLRVVYVGLKFPFWVTKSMTINLKIDKIEPAAEFGILDSTSEIIIPSLSAPVKPNISIVGFPKLRLHPIVLFKTQFNFFVPSVSLLFTNIRHAFTYKSSLSSDFINDTDHDEVDLFFYAKFFGTKNNPKKCPGVIKVFLLDNLDIHEQILDKSFPLLNPSTLYVHPKLLENFQDLFPLKSSIYLEQFSEEDFGHEENNYSPIELSNEENINTKSDSTVFVGFKSLIQNGQNFLKAALSLGNIQHSFIGPTHGNLIITGREGSGKTALAYHLVQKLSDHPFYVHSEIVSCPKLRGKKSESVEKYFKNILENAAKFQPTLITLDDFDVLCPSPRVEQQNPAEEFQCFRISETLIDCFMEYEGTQIVLIATAQNSNSLNAYWKNRQGFHFFQKHIHISPPNQLERLEIFQSCLKSYLEYTDPTATIENNDIIKPVFISQTSSSSATACTCINEKNCKLHTLSDSIKNSLSTIHDEYSSPQILRRVAEKWAFHLFKNEHNDSNLLSGDEDDDEDEDSLFQKIIDEEISNFGGSLQESTTTGKITWNQIGGLNDIKKELTKILEWPIKYPKLFENCPVKLPSGLLFYGFPGSGKTLLALSVPSIINAKFIHIKGPELLSKYIGASEQNVKDLFQRAKDSKPCILFFDEFDSLVPRRGHDSTGVTDRVVNQFLAEMDGVDGGMGQGVHLIAATSRPDLIDPAILRPGRLDKHFFFQMPTKEDRIEIVKRQSEQLNLSQWNDNDWDLIGHETEGFTGADLHSLLFSSQMASIQEYLHGKLETNESTYPRNENVQMDSKHTVVVTMEHIRRSLATFQPSLQGKELEEFHTIYENFSSARNGTLRKPGSELISMSGKRATLA